MQDAAVYALGVALSPIPIAAVLAILSGPVASVNSMAFAGGWILGLVTAGVSVALLVDGFGFGDARPGWLGAVELIIGLAFLVAATRLWVHRKSGLSRARLEAVDGFTPAHAAAFGVVLSAANPKVLALSLGSALAVARTGSGMALAGSAVALFVGIGALGVITPIAVYLVIPTHGAVGLARVRKRLAKHEGLVLGALAIAIGTFFVGDGVMALGG